MTLANAAHDRLDRIAADRRELVANSSCGVCGRTTIESLRANLAAVPPGFQVPGAWISSLPERLRAAQPVFAATGGLHAAALFKDAGAPAASAEDVGRHNAVDKIIGRMIMRDALPLSDVVLFVSGRTSFEIVQKAWCAQVPILASVSAPSSLAVALARDAGITLVGFRTGRQLQHLHASGTDRVTTTINAEFAEDAEHPLDVQKNHTCISGDVVCPSVSSVSSVVERF